jgi:hypothetical protein
MRSASAYINKIRVKTEAKTRKVQYPGMIALNTNSIYAAINCNPVFDVLRYMYTGKCIPCPSELVNIPSCNGILEGGTYNNSFCMILDGSGNEIIYDGGYANTEVCTTCPVNGSDIFDGGDVNAPCNLILDDSTDSGPLYNGGFSNTIVCGH